MPAKAARKKVSAKDPDAFSATFLALRAILKPYASQSMKVVHDKPDYYYLETTFPVMGRGPVMFAAVRIGKGYVCYHLLPLYMNPPLQKKISPELNRRKQGKACFNFSHPDERLFADLAEITRLGFKDFKKLSSPAKH